MSSAPPPPASFHSSGSTRPASPYSGSARPPMRTGRVVAIVLALLVVLLLVVGGFVFSVFSMLRNSSATASAVAAAGQNPRVVAITGLPLKTGYFVSGHVNVQTGSGGDATLTIPVSGPLGRGNVYAIERNGFAGWTPTTLEFWPASNPNDIVRIVEPRSGAEAN